MGRRRLPDVPTWTSSQYTRLLENQAQAMNEQINEVRRRMFRAEDKLDTATDLTRTLRRVLMEPQTPDSVRDALLRKLRTMSLDEQQILENERRIDEVEAAWAEEAAAKPDVAPPPAPPPTPERISDYTGRV